MLVPTPPRQKPGSPEEPGAPALAFSVVRLRVVLVELVPPVWRRLQVPSNFTLRRLHVVLQHVMGWKELPQHQFRVGTSLFGMPSENSGPLRDSRWVTLQDLLAQKATMFTYEYDAGTRWIHQVRVEGLHEGNSNEQRPSAWPAQARARPKTAAAPTPTSSFSMPADGGESSWTWIPMRSISTPSTRRSPRCGSSRPYAAAFCEGPVWPPRSRDASSRRRSGRAAAASTRGRASFPSPAPRRAPRRRGC